MEFSRQGIQNWWIFKSRIFSDSLSTAFSVYLSALPTGECMRFVRRYAPSLNRWKMQHISIGWAGNSYLFSCDMLMSWFYRVESREWQNLNYSQSQFQTPD